MRSGVACRITRPLQGEMGRPSAFEGTRKGCLCYSEDGVRNTSADLLKAILIAFVVVGHVFVEPVRESVWKQLIYQFHMPVFLALSGYFVSPKKTPAEVFRGALSRYMLPWLLATPVYFVYLLRVKKEFPFSLVRAVLEPWFHLWFIPCLLLLSVAVAAMRSLPRWIVLLVFLFPVVAMRAGVDVVRYVGPVDSRFITSGAYFALGYFLREFFQRVSARWFLVFLPAAVALLLRHYFVGLLRPERDLAAACWITGSLAAVAAFPSAREFRWSAFFSRESLGIYLYHVAALRLIRPYAERLGPELYWSLGLILGLIATPLGVRLLRSSRLADPILGSLPARDSAR